jgi:hypothetical protein
MRPPLLSGVLLVFAGLFVIIRYGLTRGPLSFNESNLIKKPLPVWAARIVYIPMGLFFVCYGVRNLIEAFR